jgi:hypothetical protein
VDCWVAGLEHADHGGVVVFGDQCFVKVGLLGFSSLESDRVVPGEDRLVDDTQFHELASEPVDDWDGGRVRDGDVIGSHADDRSVLLMQFTVCGWAIAAANHEQAVQA